MDNYSLMRFFNRLQFDELLNLAGVNSRFHHLIGHYMLAKHNIHKKVLRLRNVDHPSITANAINIGKSVTILRFLRHFGHLITKLEYTHKHHTTIEHLKIKHSIQRYCARTLLDIKMSSQRSYLIGDVNNPFEKVINVDLAIGQFDRDNLQLHRVYPHMERLNFSIPAGSDNAMITMTSLAQLYPHLKHLEFSEITGDSNLRLIVRANTQLNSLTLNMCPTVELLQFLDVTLADLKVLSISCDAAFEWASSVSMKSVRNFSIISMDRDHEPKILTKFPITFNRLEEIDIVTSTILHVPISLIKQNRRVKVLSIHAVEAIDSYSRVLEIINQLNELEVLRVTWSSEISAMETLQFLNRVPNRVQKINFIVTQRTFYSDLLTILPNQWQLAGEEFISSSVKYVTFVR